MEGLWDAVQRARASRKQRDAEDDAPGDEGTLPLLEPAGPRILQRNVSRILGVNDTLQERLDAARDPELTGEE
jgi:hypothetical protein